MKLSDKDEIKAKTLNKLQSITTVIGLCSEGKKPSEKLLKIASRDLKKLTELAKNF